MVAVVKMYDRSNIDLKQHSGSKLSGSILSSMKIAGYVVPSLSIKLSAGKHGARCYNTSILG